MKLIDVAGVNFSLSQEEILVADTSVVTNPLAFVKFLEGFNLSSDALFDPRISSVVNLGGRGLSAGLGFCQQFFHYVLPNFYSFSHLESLGGRFTLRVTGVSDYTICLFLGRVLVLNGAPVMPTTGLAVIDCEIRSDAFAAVCNNLFANLCKETLTRFETKAA